MKKVSKYNYSNEEKNKLQEKVNKINDSNLKKNLTSLINVFNKRK